MTESATATVVGRYRTRIYSEILHDTIKQIKAVKSLLVYVANRGQLQYEKTKGSFFMSKPRKVICFLALLLLRSVHKGNTHKYTKN